PNHADALHTLGVISLQRRQMKQAIDMLERAVRARPDAPEFHANYGHALRGVGRFDEAAGEFQRAIQLRPGYALAHNNLGTVRRAQGRLDEAIASYREAIRLEPTVAAMHLNLGNCLRDANLPSEAVQAFRRAIQLQPDNADAHLLLGNLLRAQNMPDDAAECFRRALRIDPRSADAHERLARTLWAQVRIEEAMSHFEQAMRIAPTPRLRAVVATLVPPVYRSKEESLTWRRRLEDEVAALKRQGFRLDITHELAPTTVYLPYQGLDDREVARDVASLFAPPADPPLPRRRGAEQRIRVGFVSALFKDQTVGLWTQGLIKELSRERFVVVVLSAGEHHDTTGRFIRQHADEFTVLSRDLPQARSQIADGNLDVLIYADLGMEPFTWTLAFSRLAPVQCAMWGHPITSGIPAIDCFISSRLAEADDAQKNYTEKLGLLEHLPLYYYRPAPPQEPRDRGFFHLPDDRHLYGCLQAQYKLHPDFDAVLAEILRKDPRGLVLLSRAGTAQAESVIRGRIAARFPDVMDQVRFMPMLSRDEFRSVCGLCDVHLAPFPFGAGDSSLECFALGVPTVTLPTPFLKGRLTHAMYRLMNIDDCTARDERHYIEIATRLATDPQFHQIVSGKIRAACELLFENRAGVAELEALLVTMSASGT
ncbi:MAG: tetratricopeptide repeat protein, partial [Tepidisphaeraceae bacterium]